MTTLILANNFGIEKALDFFTPWYSNIASFIKPLSAFFLPVANIRIIEECTIKKRLFQAYYEKSVIVK